MNNMEKHIENGYEVRDIVKNKLKYGDGYVLIDREDNKIYVDTKKGLTAQLVLVVNDDGSKHISYKWYNDGILSNKDNGYCYTPITIEDNRGKLKKIPYPTHNLVLMIEDMDGYDKLINYSNIPVGNHKNNRPWDNRAENLEWVALGDNSIHGKVLSSIHRYYSDIYTHIEHNCGDTEFIVLDQPISVKNIKEFLTCIGDQKYFKCKDTEHIGLDKVDRFIRWLIVNKDWKSAFAW